MNSPATEGVAAIQVRGARQHNLKNLDLDLPRGRLTVITGVSGSGKSSLAFDTLYAEGQRRYVESVSSYARQFLERLPRPDVDVIHGLTPAVAIQQVASARSARSTVGTATEVYDYLRLLFARLGSVHCAKCDAAVTADSPQSIAAGAAVWAEGETVLVLAPVALSERLSWEEQAAHLAHAGFTRILVGEEIVALDPLPKLPRGAREVIVVVDRFTWRASETARLAESCEQAFRRGEGRLLVKHGDRAPEKRSERWECASCGTPAMRPEPALFSFNSPLGVCPTCRGFGNVLTFTPELIVPDPSRTLRQGAIDPWARSWRSIAWPRLEKAAREHGVPLDVPWKRMSAAHRKLLLEGGEGFRGAIPFLERLQKKSYKAGNRFIVKRYQTALSCDACRGARLRPEALRVRLGGEDIAAVAGMTVARALAFVRALAFTAGEREIAGPVLHEVESRLGFLERVDLHYLTLDRLTRTLSGGEAQRIELANALGASLSDTLYVLDEPTVGLHPRDTGKLVAILKELAGRGNTLVVVEHEPMLMHAADHVVDLGPGAGEQGGHLLYAGPGGDALRGVDTETARYLRGELRVERPRATGSGPAAAAGAAPSDTRALVKGAAAAAGAEARGAATGRGRRWEGIAGEDEIPAEDLIAADAPRAAGRGRRATRVGPVPGAGLHLVIEGATHHNLKDITVRFPFGRLSAVTGVSGSGKSSLVEEVLYRAARRALEQREEEPAGAHRAIHGLEHLERVVLVDQSPIGRTPRSCPVSYLGAYAPLREVYARQPAALSRGLKDGAFSFNTAGGRCEQCQGAGWVTVEMYFLADLLVPCDACGGARFRREVLEVRYRGVNIREALDLTVDQAFEHFAREPRFTRALYMLRRVGLGYLRLGQPANQLSGGEAQRLKIARELAARGGGTALYLLDEPTVGLHFADVRRLLEVLDDLVTRGDTVIVVEHNLDVIRSCDWVVDLGPEGGDGGGELVAEGPPETIAAERRSWTGRFLREQPEGAPAPVSGG